MTRLLEDIYESASKFLYALNPDETYEAIVKESIRLVGANYGSIFLKRDGKLERAYSNLPLDAQTEIRTKGSTYHSFSQHPILVKATKEFHPETGGLNIKYDIFVSLFYKNKSIGMLILDFCSSKRPNKRDLKILQLFGSLASLVIRKTELYIETKKSLDKRDLFISMASHEFRTPLTTINGYVDLLYQETKDQKNPKAKWIKELKYEVTRLTKMVKELMEINQIKTGQLSIYCEECDISEIVEKTITSFKMVYPNRTLQFSSELDQKDNLIIGDQDKLIQAIGNVLENAARYSSADEPVIFKIKADESAFLINIQDFGIGIPKEDILKVFDDYYRGKTTFPEGMGLGLYVTKNIIDLHNSEIKISSKLDVGTTVKIKIPRKKL